MDVREFFSNIGLSVARVRTDKNEYIFYCPNHDEKEPSLNVNPIEGLYHCFGACGIKGRNMKSFFRDIGTEKAEERYYQFTALFPELIRYRYELDRDKENAKSPFEDIDLDALRYADANTPYFEKRFITQDTINKFGIRYHKLYDSLVIPVRDTKKYRGYVRRNLSSKPPYYNGLNVEGLLFPLDLVELIDSRIILVEGMFDAIRAHQEGFTNCLSTIGGEITEDQVRVIGQYTRNVVLCPDKDKQGIRIAERNTKLLRRYGYNLYFARIPGAAKDLAEAKNLNELEIKSYFRIVSDRKTIKQFILE